MGQIKIAMPMIATATKQIAKAVGPLASRFNPDLLKIGKN
jgi:hypothetical protein